MLLRQMLGFVEDIGLGINLKTGIGQAQAGRNFSDPDNRDSRVAKRPERLLAKLTAERLAVFMENIAKALRHADSAAEKNHLAPRFMRLPHRFHHIFDAAVKFFARLPLHKKRCAGRAKLFERHAPVPRCDGAQVFR